MKKFELTNETKLNWDGKKLFRIKALVSFGNVKEGDLGGWVEKEENLSHSGDAWVCGNAEVSGNAWVYDDAWVCGDAWVYDDAKVGGDAWVYGNAKVYDDAKVYGNAKVYGDAWVYDDAWVCGNAEVSGNARVGGDADYTAIKGFGSEYRNTTFFRCRDKSIKVKCGCFEGTIEEFKAKVRETHRDSKFAVEYLKIAELMEYHFSEE